MSDTDVKTPETAETHSFQAEVAELLRLMVHSVYSEKSVFLREALSQIGLAKRGSIAAMPFEQVQPPAVMFVTCRALDEFMNKVSAMVNWAPKQSTLLLFGGETLRRQLETLEVRYTEFLIPLSEKRFLFEVVRTSQSR